MDLKNYILRLRRDLVTETVFLTKDSKTGTDKRVDDLVRVAYGRGATDTLHIAINAMLSLIDCYVSDQVTLEALYSHYGNYLAQQAEADPKEPDAWTRGRNAAVNLILDKLESLFSDLQREKATGSHS